MAIEKTGAKLLRRFKLPERNIDLALVRTKEGVLELYKNSKIAGSGVDSFTKVAEKRTIDPCYSPILRDVPKTVIRKQFNSKGEEIGYSKIIVDIMDNSIDLKTAASNKPIYMLGGKEGVKRKIEIMANDKSVYMSGGVIKIDSEGVKVVGKEFAAGSFLDKPADDVIIKFTRDKLTPMAKRILNLLNKAANK